MQDVVTHLWRSNSIWKGDAVSMSLTFLLKYWGEFSNDIQVFVHLNIYHCDVILLTRWLQFSCSYSNKK